MDHAVVLTQGEAGTDLPLLTDGHEPGSETGMVKQDERTRATRAALLDAVIRVIEQHGPQQLTLDAVAREAGLSKGGLIYHFSSKQALVSGLLERALTDFENRIESLHDRQPGGYVRAFVLAASEATASTTYLRTSAALLVAMTHHPGLLGSYIERSKVWQSRLESDGLYPTWATIARLTVDGLYLASLFGNDVTFEAQRDRVLQRLLNLTLAGVPYDPQDRFRGSRVEPEGG